MYVCPLASICSFTRRQASVPGCTPSSGGLLSVSKSSLESMAEAQRRPGPCPRVMGEEAVRDRVGFAERCWALLVKMLLAKC